MEQHTTKVLFLSWAGDESKDIAIRFKDLMEFIFFPGLKAYMSAVDTPLGKRSVEELSRQLGECNYGVCLITRENARAPWIHYEAGAIAKENPISRLMVLLLDNDPSCIDGTPLGDFKYSLFNHDGVLEIINTLIEICGFLEKKDLFVQRFEESWDSFEEKCRKSIEDARKISSTEEQKGTEYDSGLETVMHVLVDIRNYLKDDIGNSVKNINSFSHELKELMQSSKDLSMMQVQYKNGRYEKLLSGAVNELDEVITMLEKFVKDNGEKDVDEVRGTIESLKNLHEELCSQIFD